MKALVRRIISKQGCEYYKDIKRYGMAKRVKGARFGWYSHVMRRAGH